MAAFVGKYFYEKSEHLEEFLSKIAGPEVAEFFKQFRPALEVFYSGDEYTYVFISGDKKIAIKFKLNYEFDETFFDGVVFKSFVTKEGDKFHFVSKLANGNVIYRDYTFSSEGLYVTYNDKKYNLHASSFYKRA